MRWNIVDVRKRIFRGDRLRSMREARKFTQTEIAERLSIGQNQIYRYETGQAEPSPVIMAGLAEVLGVTTDWLLGLTNESSKSLREDDLSPSEQTLLSAYRRGDLRKLMQLLSEEPERA